MCALCAGQSMTSTAALSDLHEVLVADMAFFGPLA